MKHEEIEAYFGNKGAPRILLIDADAQCNLSTVCLGEDVFEEKIIKKKGNTLNDLIFIDCPPNLYYITQNALFASDYYLIPTIPNRLSCYGIPSIYKKVNHLNHLLKQSCAGYVETNKKENV